MKKRYLLSAIALTASTLLMPCVAGAQDFPPKRPVTLFVGFAPGGAADAAARLIAKKLTENIGQNVIVENKAGAGGNIVHQQNDRAIGHTVGYLLVNDVAASTCFVFHNDVLTDVFGELFGN